jgi:hypothetical protein
MKNFGYEVTGNAVRFDEDEYGFHGFLKWDWVGSLQAVDTLLC